jgi:hypothetical protein
MNAKLDPVDANKVTKDYFEQRVQPAIDNGADVQAHLDMPYKTANKRKMAMGLDNDYIMFLDDGRSVGAPSILAGFVKDLFPGQIEAVAVLDKRLGSYKGWSWQFFPGKKHLAEGK